MENLCEKAYENVKAVLAEYPIGFEETEPLSSDAPHSFLWQYKGDDHIGATIDCKEDGTVMLMLFVTDILRGVDREEFVSALSCFSEIWYFDEPIIPQHMRLAGLPVRSDWEHIAADLPAFLDAAADFIDFIAGGALDEYLQA